MTVAPAPDPPGRAPSAFLRQFPRERGASRRSSYVWWRRSSAARSVSPESTRSREAAADASPLHTRHSPHADVLVTNTSSARRRGSRMRWTAGRRRRTAGSHSGVGTSLQCRCRLWSGADRRHPPVSPPGWPQPATVRLTAPVRPPGHCRCSRSLLSGASPCPAGIPRRVRHDVRPVRSPAHR